MCLHNRVLMWLITTSGKDQRLVYNCILIGLIPVVSVGVNRAVPLPEGLAFRKFQATKLVQRRTAVNVFAWDQLNGVRAAPTRPLAPYIA